MRKKNLSSLGFLSIFAKNIDKRMDTQQFIQDFREAFGQKAALPLLFGYSDQPMAATEKIGGCFFKGLQAAREGS